MLQALRADRRVGPEHDGGLGGMAVHIGARIAALAEGGEILLSRTVKDLVVGSGVAFTNRGSHELKGVPDRWELFALDRVAAADLDR